MNAFKWTSSCLFYMTDVQWITLMLNSIFTLCFYWKILAVSCRKELWPFNPKASWLTDCWVSIPKQDQSPPLTRILPSLWGLMWIMKAHFLVDWDTLSITLYVRIWAQGLSSKSESNRLNWEDLFLGFFCNLIIWVRVGISSTNREAAAAWRHSSVFKD